MAERKEFPRVPPERRAHYVYGHRLHAWFAIGSAALLVSVVGMIWQDYAREWKTYQRKFWDLKKTRFEQEYREHYYTVQAKAAKLVQDEKAAEAALASAKGVLHEQARKLDDLERRELYVAKQQQKFAKANLDTGLFQLEEARKRAGVEATAGYADQQSHFDALMAEFLTRDAELKVVEAKVKQLAAEIEQQRKDVLDAQRKREELTRERDNTHRNLQKMQPSLANALRDMPMLDFVDPNLKIKQTVIDDIQLDIYFAKVQIVDRCQTCHLGIDDPHWTADKVNQPFQAHPRLDLYLTGKSPHPVERFGCTVCHRGRPPATEFVWATHTPNDHHQETEWKATYHWEHDHWWNRPMLPTKFTEASCLKCHADAVELPGAEKLMRGKRLFRDFGCYGCHKATGMEDVTVGGTLPRRGPSLKGLPGKTTADWTYRWIWDPKQFRPSTRMPRFFGQDNNKSGADEAREQAELAGIVAYLWTFGDAPKHPRLLGGDAARGRTVVESVGCTACHRVEDPPAVDPADERRVVERVAGTMLRNHGPELSRIGLKTTPEWIAAWVADPQAHSPGSRMPSLRLSDRERADVAAYLMTRTAGPATPAAPPTDHAQVAAVLRDYLEQTLPPAAAASEAEVFKFRDDWMDEAAHQRVKDLPAEQQRLLKVGQVSIRKYGCAGCHEIAGFETESKIGTDLYKQGSKPLTKLDFGLLGLHHGYEEIKPGTVDAQGVPLPAGVPITLHDFMLRKLQNPRVYDWGKTKAPRDRLKMPNFEMTADEAEDVLTFVLGMTDDPMALARTAGAKKDDPTLDAHAQRYRAEQAGWAVIRENNCGGCHRFEDEALTFRQRRPKDPAHPEAIADHLRTPHIRSMFTPDKDDDVYANDQDVTIRGVTADEDEGIRTFQLRSPHAQLPGQAVGAKLEFTPADEVRHEPHMGEGIAQAYLEYRKRKEGKPNLRLADILNDLPPRLVDQGFKVQPPWVFEFLRDVAGTGTIRPWLEIRMPQFALSDADARAVAHFFAAKAWGEQAARLDFLDAVSKKLKSDADRITDADAQKHHRAEMLAAHAAMKARLDGEPDRYGERARFANAFPFERYGERTPEYLARREAEFKQQRGTGRYLDKAWAITQHKDVLCFKCHFLAGKAPQGEKADWAPDLARARDRLRPQWIEWWLTAPSKVLPGTKMPDIDWKAYHDLVPGDDRDRVRALKDLLMNLDAIAQK